MKGQWAKAHITKHGEVSLVLRTHMAGGENGLPRVVLSRLRVCYGMSTLKKINECQKNEGETVWRMA